MLEERCARLMLMHRMAAACSSSNHRYASHGILFTMLMNVTVLHPRDPHHARAAIRSCELAYIAEPSVENARDLVLSVQAYWMGTRRSDAFLDMNAMAEADDVLYLCTNAILRALRLARRYANG